MERVGLVAIAEHERRAPLSVEVCERLKRPRARDRRKARRPRRPGLVSSIRWRSTRSVTSRQLRRERVEVICGQKALHPTLAQPSRERVPALEGVRAGTPARIEGRSDQRERDHAVRDCATQSEAIVCAPIDTPASTARSMSAASSTCSRSRADARSHRSAALRRGRGEAVAAGVVGEHAMAGALQRARAHDERSDGCRSGHAARRSAGPRRPPLRRASRRRR